MIVTTNATSTIARPTFHLCGLDALRGVAAILVVLWHVLYLKRRLGLASHEWLENTPVINQGPMAVTFFFVLSGFLITLLLLREREATGNVCVRRFYLRRVLRIWPVYYTCLALGLFLPPMLKHAYFSPEPLDCRFPNILWHALLFPNVARTENPICFQSWSIGVEEQFYLMWPWVFICFCRSWRGLLAFVLVLTAALLCCRASHVVWPNHFTDGLNQFFGRTRFDNMAIGGLAGWAFYRRALPRSVLAALATWLTTAALRLQGVSFPFGMEHVAYSVLFAISIYYVVVFTTAKSFLESWPFRYLGQISYGMYMYHVIAIYCVLNAIRHGFGELPTDSLQFEVLAYSGAVIVSVGLAVVSYHCLEKPFLDLKSYLGAVSSAAERGPARRVPTLPEGSQ